MVYWEVPKSAGWKPMQCLSMKTALSKELLLEIQWDQVDFLWVYQIVLV